MGIYLPTNTKLNTLSLIMSYCRSQLEQTGLPRLKAAFSKAKNSAFCTYAALQLICVTHRT